MKTMPTIEISIISMTPMIGWLNADRPMASALISIMSTTIQHDETHTVVSGNREMGVQAGTNTETIKGDASLTVQAGKRSVVLDLRDPRAIYVSELRRRTDHAQGHAGLRSGGSRSAVRTGDRALLYRRAPQSGVQR